MKLLEFFISIPLYLLKGISYCINFIIIFLILLIPAVIFVFLSMFNHECFWDEKWNSMLDSLERKGLIPK